ncbi:MAG: SpoIID/LytB domain-containing protein [Lachnospiraceae bacterium]|nr:SpoIID/LytB domain-containing protein [Lachnospiraceae bacterium]
MREKVKLYVSAAILILFIPWLLTVYLWGGGSRFSASSGEDEQLEEQVVRVLAAEIPADYDLECLKAQAVIVRTNLSREGEDAEKGWDEAAMREAWGEAYEKNLDKIQTAVSETEGLVLTYEGELILAAYHRASNEKTRNAEEVPGQEAYTWLQSVPCQEDILAEGFLYVGYMEKEELAAALAELFPDEEMNAEDLPGTLRIAERDSADYVTQVQYGETIVNGEAVRSALELQSSCFYFSELEGKIRIVTKGIGHGLGFSQYGAERMAEQGAVYTELLSYFYQGVKIEKLQ